MVRAQAWKARGPGSGPGPGTNFFLSILKLMNRRPCYENYVFNITSLSDRNTKYPCIYSHSRVCECMPLQGL